MTTSASDVKPARPLNGWARPSAAILAALDALDVNLPKLDPAVGSDPAEAAKVWAAWLSDVVKVAWRKRIQAEHPDRATGDTDEAKEADRQRRTAKAQDINRAWSVLSQVKHRAPPPKEATAAAPRPSGGPPRRRREAPPPPPPPAQAFAHDSAFYAATEAAFYSGLATGWGASPTPSSHPQAPGTIRIYF